MVMTVMIVLGIGTINGLIIKRFLFYRLWKPKRGRTCEGKLGTCDSRCFVGSELHDDAIVLKICHSAAVASVCPVDFRISPDAATRDPFRLFAKGSVESTHKVPTSHYHTKLHVCARVSCKPLTKGTPCPLGEIDLTCDN